MLLSLRSRLARASLLAAALLSMNPAPAAPVPVADFFAQANYTAARLSPDGRHLALLVHGTSGFDRLGVVDLTGTGMKVVAQFADADVGQFEWVNNERLVYDSRNNHASPAEDRYFAPGLFAVNRDGSGARRLVDVRNFGATHPSVGQDVLPYNTYMLRQPGAQNSTFIYVAAPERDARGTVRWVDLLHLDTASGRATTVPRPGNTRSWWLDAKGEPRLSMVLDENIASYWYRDPADGKWRKLASFDAYVDPRPFVPLGFGPDGTLYVTATGGADKTALFRYDLVNNRLEPRAVVRLERFDFHGSLVRTDARVLGAYYLADALETLWFDEHMKQVQAALDQALPGLTNVMDLAARAETPWVIVNSYSDRQPRVLRLYNTATGELRKIGDSQPRIVAAEMAAMDVFPVKARDGMTIPTWLTVPNNSKGRRLPLVVLVHDHPLERGSAWKWDPEAQFLASRGYAVLEPEYRGSTGFGDRHFRAGWKQWGLGMQDDIADATRWAIDEGIADPARICIAGSGYGGYATVMGLIRYPELYRCGIDWGGIADIGLMYTGHWSADAALTDDEKRYGMPALVGDPVKDAAQLAATSPLRQAARITQPLLLAHGALDWPVPVYHGRQLYEAVGKTSKQVEWVEYKDEGHGWKQGKTAVDFWTRVEKFLDRNIGSGTP